MLISLEIGYTLRKERLPRHVGRDFVHWSLVMVERRDVTQTRLTNFYFRHNLHILTAILTGIRKKKVH